MFSTLFYLQVTISIVAKYANCFVLENSVGLKNEAKSQTDNRHTVYSDSSSYSNNENVDNHIRTSTINVTEIDNTMEMPKPNDALDYLTFQTSLESGDALTEVETGRKKRYGGGGSKFGKYKIGKSKKKYKWLYPVIIGVFITKMIMFPLFVKAVTILSSAAFVFSKMSLLASLVLSLKFFLSNNGQNNDSKVEIVHVPLKKYGSDWDRETSESKYHNAIADNIYEHELRPTRFVL